MTCLLSLIHTVDRYDNFMGMSETINSPITRRSFLTGSAALGIGVASALALSGPQASAATVNDAVLPNAPKAKSGDKVVAVSYTHLTLPTICSV